MQGRRAALHMARGTLLALVASAVGGPGGRAQEAPWSSWSAYVENDTFDFWDGSDRRYTNGVRWTLARDTDQDWEWTTWTGDLASRVGLLWGRPWDEQGAIGIGQNIFTPSMILSGYDDPTDRPFVGYLYGGLRAEITQAPDQGWKDGRFHARGQYTFELDVGFVGTPALGREAQAGFHVLRANRLPDWQHQLSPEPTITLNAEHRISLRKWKYFELIPLFGMSVGNVQTLAKGGLTARVGNLVGFPTVLIPNSLMGGQDDTGGVSVFASYELRAYAYNLFVQGELIGGRTKLAVERLVPEARLGGEIRWDSWTLSYARVLRGKEFKNAPGPFKQDHSFGSFSVSRVIHPDWENRSEDLPHRIQKWWMVEASIGRGTIHEPGSAQADPPLPSGAGQFMRIGILKGIVNERWLVGLEVAGAARPQEPVSTGGWRREGFLTATALTGAYRPRGRAKGLMFRAGAGLGKTKVQRLRNIDYREEFEPIRKEKGWSFLAGASYSYKVVNRASVGLDLNWYHFRFNDPTPMSASFWAWGLGFKWHP